MPETPEQEAARPPDATVSTCRLGSNILEGKLYLTATLWPPRFRLNRLFFRDAEVQSGKEQVDTILATALDRENEKGRDKYGPDFVGDPMTQAVEELIGALRYMATELAIVRNAQAHYRQQIAALQDRLKVREP